MRIENQVNPDMDELIHFGVKGMKWGVRKKYDAHPNEFGTKESGQEKANRNETTKAYMAIKPRKVSAKQQEEALKKNQAKFISKFGDNANLKPKPEDAEASFLERQKEKHWDSKTTGQKAALVGKVAVTTAVVGYVGYSVYANHKMLAIKGGEPISANALEFKTAIAKSHSWNGTGYIKPSSYNQKEFTLPVGHVFHRLSTNVETSFGDATYATSNVGDFNRYLTAFRGELMDDDNLHHITWTTNQPIKVPDLVTRLETLREVMTPDDLFDSSPVVTKDHALGYYQMMCGDSWDSPLAKRFFSALEAKGFGAIIDDMDAGVVGEAPLVLFKKDAMTSKVAEKLTPEMIKLAENSITEIYNRK